MSNIAESPFSLYVKSQIEARQFMLGLKNRPIDITRYLTNRMPWVRLTSTTNISQPDNKNSVLYKLNRMFDGTAALEGSALRKNLILQNFPRFIPPNPVTGKASYLEGFGFNRGETIDGVVGYAWSEGAYGFGGASDRGYVPPPDEPPVLPPPPDVTGPIDEAPAFNLLNLVTTVVGLMGILNWVPGLIANESKVSALGLAEDITHHKLLSL